LIEWVYGVIAGFVNTSVKSIGVEKLALVLAGIGIISSNVKRCLLCSGRSASNDVVNARVIIAEGESTTEPSPLKSPSSVS
jgi:hypothetical protein